jgi:Transglycosylase SLT domain
MANPWDNDPVVGAAPAADLTINDRDLNAVRHVESGGNPNAVSPRGARGPYQFMPATAASLGLGEEDVTDEVKSRAAAKTMLQRLTDKFGSKELAFAAYNWGEGNLEKHGIDKAPEETQNYVKKISKAMGTAPAPKGNPWDKDPVVDGGDQEVKPTALVQQMKPSSGPLLDVAKRTAGDAVSFADMVLSTPGMVAGFGADLMTRVQGAVRGEDRKTVATAAGMMSQDIAAPSAHLASDAVRKVMELAGYGKDAKYDESDVDKVMGHLSDALGKGGEWVEKQTHGLLLKEDVASLTNEFMALGGLKGISAGVKGAAEKATAPKPPPGAMTSRPSDVPSLREDPGGDKPVTRDPSLNPAARVQKDIEQVTGIKDPAAQEKLYAQQRADARAAYKDDPQYADYLGRYAEEEVRQREVAAMQADVAEQVKYKINPAIFEMDKKQEVTWNQALPIYKTPGFLRTPEQIVRLRSFEKQGGKADPTTLAYMAGAGLAIGAGVYLDPQHPIEGALLGLAGLAVSKTAGTAAVAVVKSVVAARSISAIFKADDRISIADQANQWEYSQAAAARDIWQQQSKVMDLVKDPARRSAITHWIQGNKAIPLTDSEYAAAVHSKDFFAEMGKAGQASGVLDNLLDDYVTNLWDLNGTNKAAGEKIFANMSPNSRFNMQRKISSLEEGKKMGLTPVTEDIATIIGIYGNSLSRTMANNKLLTSLKAAEISGTEGQRLVMPQGTMPKNYVNGISIHPTLAGNGIHPDIAPSMKFMYDAKSGSQILAAVENINMASKRLAVSFSLFHAKALTDAFIGAGGKISEIPSMAKGTNQFIKMIRSGGAGDIVDTAELGGLKFSFNKGTLADEDIKGNFYAGLDRLHAIANERIPAVGTAIKGVEKLNMAMDELMWNRLHAGMKLSIFSKTYEELKKNNVLSNAKNPEVALKSREQLAKISASYTNDIFGGLNWRRIAEESTTKLGKDLSMEVMSPHGRRTLQLATFAPDWTLSTTRAAVKAFGPGSGVKGLLKPEELSDLHRQYLLRSALYYFTVGNALNYAMSGHMIWDNKDWTMLELRNGQTMQFSKHMMEPVHWMTKPLQQTVNKLGILPREFITQATGKEYISTTGKAPPMDTSVSGRLRHLAKGAMPIATSGEGSIETMLSSALGFPIYGKTDEQRADAKAARAYKGRVKKDKPL